MTVKPSVPPHPGAPRMTTREALRSAVAREVGPGKVDAVLRAVAETMGEPVAWGVWSDYPAGGEAWSGIYHSADAATRDAELLYGCVSRVVPLISLSALLYDDEPMVCLTCGEASHHMDDCPRVCDRCFTFDGHDSECSALLDSVEPATDAHPARVETNE